MFPVILWFTISHAYIEERVELHGEKKLPIVKQFFPKTISAM